MENLNKHQITAWRKYQWAGWYARWDWRFDCRCGRKGMAFVGARNHLKKACNTGDAGAISLLEKAKQNPEQRPAIITVGGVHLKLEE